VAGNAARQSTNDPTATGNEVAVRLDGPVPRTLGVLDQGAFWANLGVSLLGFAGVLAVLQPSGATQLTVAAAVLATIVGTVIGSAMVGLSAIPGAMTGAPAMVLLRGLFGGRLSAVPTFLNVVQLIGWGTFELVVIAQAAQTAFPGTVRWVWVVGAGVLTVLLTLRPLGTMRLLRRVVTIAVAISLAYLAWHLLRHPLPSLGEGSWESFWKGADAAIAVAISWIPVASDYSRHSRTPFAAFTSATIGYSIAQIVTFLLGLVALALVAGNGDAVFSPMLAVPFGLVAFLVLTVREVDQSFANVYSTAVSVQNLLPRADRRVLTVAIGALIMLLALALDINSYADFLLVIGSVFVPLLGVGVGDALARRQLVRDLSPTAPSRPLMLLAWLIGLVVYQLVNPGGLAGWSDGWIWAQHAVHLSPPSWLSASLLSFVCAGIAAFALVPLEGRARRARSVRAGTSG
jgi:putative hydroxymethylpyrimidine transporter CytX